MSARRSILDLMQASLPGVQVVRKEPSAEDLFAEQCYRARLPPFCRQERFAVASSEFVSDTGKPRQWRFDFAWPAYWLAVEIDGVVVRRVGGRMMTTGRHSDVAGMRDDNEKINAAIYLGWSVLRFLQTDVRPRLALDTTMRVLAARGWKPTP